MGKGKPVIVRKESRESTFYVEIAFPAKDLTLFASFTNWTDLVSVAWSQVSGPAAAVLSAPWALHTTVTFAITGVYVFRCTKYDGSATTTETFQVTVLSAASQTAFYVDPTYTGGGNNGSASAPWTTLAVTSGNAAWTAINAALASNHVVVYFSARIAGADTPEVETASINLWRTDTSTHRLTLDGMSKYNTNDTTPSWSDYSGSTKFNIDIASGSLSIGVQSDQITFPMHYTTIRGFDISGASGRVLIAGSHTVFEHSTVHDITATGATVQLQASVAPGCAEEFGILTGITFRNLVIEKGEGEGLYIGNNYYLEADGGCPSFGNGHYNILLEGNTIIDPGFLSGQGDGIDLKTGLRNVTVRGNTVTTTHTAGANGIVSIGLFNAGTVPGNILIEQNRLKNTGGMAFTHISALIIRNNIIEGRNPDGGHIGIYLAGIGSGPQTNFDVQIYNNTLYSLSTADAFRIGVVDTDGVSLRNNIMYSGSGVSVIRAHSNNANFSSDYNMWPSDVTSDPWSGEGANSVSFTPGSTQFVSPGTGDFNLDGASAALDEGVDLNLKAFANDLDGTARPQGSAWDMGAAELEV